MDNFSYHNPTRIIFGRGSIAKLSAVVPAGTKVLMTYGGGSIKRNGVHEQVTKALQGRTVLEFSGIQPNPLYETLMEAVKVVKKEGIGLLLAVGGGSVLDGTKFIAAAARYDGGDPWEILSKNAPVKSAVPVATVLTLPATGSESNGFAVISRKSTQEKLAFGSEHTYPRFAILDPATTFSLPAKQVRNGIVDAFIHVMEQYCTYPQHATLQDRQAEAVLLTLIERGPRALADSNDYDARADYMWAATQALNGLIGVGVVQDWATHSIGHELTAFYGLDHAETLAIVLPSLLRHRRERKAAKLAQFARRVWGVTDANDPAAIEKGIAAMEGFFHSLGMPTKLADYKISPADAAKRVSERFTQRNAKIGENGEISPADAGKILLSA